MYNLKNESRHLIGLLWGWNKIILVKCLPQNKYLINVNCYYYYCFYFIFLETVWSRKTTSFGVKKTGVRLFTDWMHELCKLLNDLWNASLPCKQESIVKKKEDNWGIWTLLTVGVSIIFHNVKELQGFFFFWCDEFMIALKKVFVRENPEVFWDKIVCLGIVSK